ncbi:MAG TPA: HK97 gp10 family phage protein, partial [Burkholderiales bacterium]|nr:HK97 gp10 family phage protein [Burkholderiales bacterium]
MAEEFRVAGLAELYQTLEQLPLKLEKNILRGAIRAGAKVVADDARRRAPVLTEADPRRVPGALAKSVRVMSTGVKGGVVKGGVVVGQGR